MVFSIFSIKETIFKITYISCYKLLQKMNRRRNEMRNYKCYGTRDGRMPMTMPDPADFGDSQKDAVTMYHTAAGEPVILRRSIALTPMPWCIHRGTSTVFFSYYRDAIEHCRKRGYKVTEEG